MLPSEFGKFKSPSMLTYPDPLALNSMLSFDLLAFITLSVIVTPSAVIVESVNAMEVKVPAAGVVPPMTTLSAVPWFMSIFETCTEPVPFPESTKSSLERVTLITLSVKFMLESIVRLDTFTTPVPPGDKFKSAFELVLIMLSLNNKLSTVVVPTKDEAPDTVSVESVDAPVTSKVELIVTAPDSVGAPAFSVPSTSKFSFMLTVAESTATIDVPENPRPSITTVSYTHLTLPTICSV